VVGRLDDDDVRAEVGTKQETQRPDLIGFLGLTTRQTQLSELLVRTKHHKLRTKHHSEQKHSHVITSLHFITTQPS